MYIYFNPDWASLTKEINQKMDLFPDQWDEGEIKATI